MKILKNKFNILLSFIFILFAQNIYAVESKDPIKLTLHDWTGQLITTNIMAEVLKEAGYNVELVPADYIAQFAGLQTGDLHVAMEMWENHPSVWRDITSDRVCHAAHFLQFFELAHLNSGVGGVDRVP